MLVLCAIPQVGEEVLGLAAKVEVSKESTTIVGDGSSEAAVKARVKQIRTLVEQTELDYEKEKLNERIARLSGGVAIIQVHDVEMLQRNGTARAPLSAAECQEEEAKRAHHVPVRQHRHHPRAQLFTVSVELPSGCPAAL